MYGHCLMLNAFVNYTLFSSCLLACIIHILVGLTLITAVIRLSQLDIDHLGKRGFELIKLASQIGII